MTYTKIPHVRVKMIAKCSMNCHFVMCEHMKIMVSANWDGPAATNLRRQSQRLLKSLWNRPSCSQTVLKPLCSWRWPRTHPLASTSEVLVLQGHCFVFVFFFLTRLLPKCIKKFLSLSLSFRENKKGMKAQNGHLKPNCKTYSCNWSIIETSWGPKNYASIKENANSAARHSHCFLRLFRKWSLCYFSQTP